MTAPLDLLPLPDLCHWSVSIDPWPAGSPCPQPASPRIKILAAIDCKSHFMRFTVGVMPREANCTCLLKFVGGMFDFVCVVYGGVAGPASCLYRRLLCASIQPPASYYLLHSIYRRLWIFFAAASSFLFSICRYWFVIFKTGGLRGGGWLSQSHAVVCLLGKQWWMSAHGPDQ